MISMVSPLRRERLDVVASCLAVLLTFAPLFFQLDGRLYTDPETLAAPRGTITNLPIPFSVPLCAIALAVMPVGWLRQPRMLLLISAVPLMLVTSLVAGNGAISWPKAKLLLFQFSLPMAGFALGWQLGRDERSVTRAGKCLLILTSVFVGAHLASTWIRHNSVVLSSDVFGLAVYGHLQYVPVIVMASYLVGLFAVCAPERSNHIAAILGIVFTPLITVYVATSMSILAIVGLWTGVALLTRTAHGRAYTKLLAVTAVVTVVLSTAVVVMATMTTPAFRAKFLSGGTETTQEEASSIEHAETRLLPNLSERFVYWDYFLAGSTSDLGSFLFGHAEQPDIRHYPSAHNYYLDLAYNFGVIPLLPIVMAIAWTAHRGWGLRGELRHRPQLAGLMFVTFFLLLADNGLKVGMRQLYPGFATFFLWGMLDVRLGVALRAHVASHVRTTAGRWHALPHSLANRTVE